MRFYGYWHNRAVDGKALQPLRPRRRRRLRQARSRRMDPLVKMSPQLAEDVSGCGALTGLILARRDGRSGAACGRCVIREYGSDADRATMSR